MAYAVGVCVILLMPTASLAIWVVGNTSDVLEALGVPAVISEPSRVEFLLNILMFTPITFIGAWHWHQVRWTEWVAYTFLASVSFELVQAIALPGRTAQHADVVANTAGGLLGAVACLAYFRLMARR